MLFVGTAWSRARGDGYAATSGRRAACSRSGHVLWWALLGQRSYGLPVAYGRPMPGVKRR